MLNRFGVPFDFSAVRVRAAVFSRKVIIRIWLDCAVMNNLGIRARRDDVIARFYLKQKTRDLPDLLTDDKITRIFGVLLAVNRAQFIKVFDARQIYIMHPADSCISAFEKIFK